MTVTQATLDVNSLEVCEARLSCIHFVPLLGLLRSRTAAAIKHQFLLKDTEFAKEYDVLPKDDHTDLPWSGGYGNLFWKRYVPNRRADQLWRGLVPLKFDLSSIIGSVGLSDGTVDASVFLYPWGMGILIDVLLKASHPLTSTVDRLQDIRNRPAIDWNIGTEAGQASPAGLASKIRDVLLPIIYGDGFSADDFGEQFTVATITDAAEVDWNDPIPEGGALHRVLEGLTGWKAKWQSIQPNAGSLQSCRIASASAPAGHIVYGKSRSRTVWFPGSFRTVSNYPNTLSCYHQNLSMATLHTEALCVLAEDAAAPLTAGGSLLNASATYRSCARLAAGLLGRLHGRKSDESVSDKPPTYRSGSVRAQIQLHRDAINKIRGGLLANGTPLDA